MRGQQLQLNQAVGTGYPGRKPRPLERLQLGKFQQVFRGQIAMYNQSVMCMSIISSFSNYKMTVNYTEKSLHGFEYILN